MMLFFISQTRLYQDGITLYFPDPYSKHVFTRTQKPHFIRKKNKQ